MVTIKELIEGATKTVVRVEKVATVENTSCQIHLWWIIDYGNGETAMEHQVLEPGNIGEVEFEQAWEAIPDRPENVNIAIAAKVPKQMKNRIAWGAYKVKYAQNEGSPE